MAKTIQFQLLDVFTSEPFGGNPLAIFNHADGLSAEQMLKIAKELNLSESVFLSKTSSDADVKMRIFTPGMELPTAGHPTIGTSYYLLKHKGIIPKKENELLLQQNIGNLRVQFEEKNGEVTKILMEQPLPKFEQTFKDKKLVASLLSIEEDEIEEDFPCRIVNCGNPFLIVPIKNLNAVHKLKLNNELFSEILDEIFITGVMAFTLETENPEHLTHSRMFAPHIGVPEDPATGSAHGPLACYLHNYNMADLNELSIGEQGYEISRPSQVKMKIIQEDGKISKVLVGGSCVHIGGGEIRIP
ncbi:trans-2,3-dihydro-3-hydroxyanthranilate isomerase [Marivirga sericea]|uniref:Trans-2,3-dihydro-3-hydroxyanthranilate isomerase n=1 Tax=Marivirga sericea TaxID=1028 RepID=A0A1X7JXY4_9BACT|nr:PhzF family phenazine biosynthesis protein [Marivirga sericea]SMG33163.1 trans-2,3-dihydro-3-hydroxyanthranilate isomerase [Marivirga sericea]